MTSEAETIPGEEALGRGEEGPGVLLNVAGAAAAEAAECRAEADGADLGRMRVRANTRISHPGMNHHLTKVRGVFLNFANANMEYGTLSGVHGGNLTDFRPRV